jgi:hypothetical protein
MSIAQEIQMRGKSQKIKKGHDTMFLKVEEHPPMDGDIYED